MLFAAGAETFAPNIGALGPFFSPFLYFLINLGPRRACGLLVVGFLAARRTLIVCLEGNRGRWLRRFLWTDGALVRLRRSRVSPQRRRGFCSFRRDVVSAPKKSRSRPTERAEARERC